MKHRIPTTSVTHLVRRRCSVDSIAAVAHRNGARTEVGLHSLLVADAHAEIDRLTVEDIDVLAALLLVLRGED